ncbi:hypothetical protein J3T28_21750 [Salmonella enterica]|uniref:hypothetical protein n=1 Tax=Salmonella enterica TaxID=28901 RepID=UPI0018D0233A|nr:hypothetical protein [Salmonella enterica]MBH0601293.1 hypothetical protein [Salmonella enterica]MBH0654989.1 hypothetical protein [Salmonella enterica]MBH0667779.1 hypothetical protein [Salmonella enterica]MCU7163120.1 hypothetical protein [Salmonella enterica]
MKGFIPAFHSPIWGKYGYCFVESHPGSENANRIFRTDPLVLLRISRVPGQRKLAFFVSYNNPGITPLLPKSTKPPVTRATTGYRPDQNGKSHLYGFGFTRNNVGYPNTKIHLLRFIVVEGSTASGQNMAISPNRALREK